MLIKKRKKAQPEATNAATLVALIGGLILLYILFLPPSERKELLGENKTEGGNGGVEEGENATLLSESPGRLDVLARDEYEHDIPTFTLFKTTNTKELFKANPFFIRNSWFSKKDNALNFKIDDLANTDKIILSFTAVKYKGMLTIKLNGNVVFENEITSVNIEPIELPKNLLNEDNVLEFSVSDVGWVFWKANEYSLQNVKIIGDVTDTSRQESKNVFYITGTEAFNIESANLKFNPECNVAQVGTLDIFLNSANIFSGVPDCGILNKVEFSPETLDSGTNKIIFKTDKGSYLIDQIKVTTKLKELTYPTYYFELSNEQFNDIKDNNKDIILRLTFPDDKENREATFIVNVRRFSMDTDEPTFSKNLDSYAKEGNNYIKIIPETTLEIVELKVTLG